MDVMDAEWRPRGTSDPDEYSRKCARRRDNKVRAFVQRLFVGAVVCLVSAVALAIMVGGIR